MKIIFGKMSMGKTSECIKRADTLEKEGYCAYIVTNSHKTARNIIKLAEHMKCYVQFPLTYHEFVTGKFCGKHIDFFILDDLDLFLQSIARNKVDLITMDENNFNIELMARSYSIKGLK